VRFVLTATSKLTLTLSLIFAVTLESRAYISPVDQRKMVATRLIHEVFARVVAGAPPQWSKGVAPLPVCTEEEVKRSVGDPVKGPEILATCRLTPDFFNTPYNLERTGWLLFKSPPGWKWKLDIDDASACSAFVDQFTRIYQYLKIVLRDPSDTRGRESFLYEISGNPIWFSMGELLSIRGIRRLDAACEGGSIAITLVP
jgi:hypothetical protein